MTLETALPITGPAVMAHAKGDLRIDELTLAAPADSVYRTLPPAIRRRPGG